MAQRLPSLDLIHSLFERERDRQLTHFDALDTKAGVVLGFSGVVLVLQGEGGLLSFLSLIGALMAAAWAMFAFWPKALPALQPARSRTYLTAEEQFTRLSLVDTQLLMLEESGQVLTVKSRRLKGAIVALALGAAARAIDVSGWF